LNVIGGYTDASSGSEAEEEDAGFYPTRIA